MPVRERAGKWVQFDQDSHVLGIHDTEQQARAADNAWTTETMRQGSGTLHRQMGVPAGESLPPEKLRQAARRDGQTGARARLVTALNKGK